LFPNAGGTPFKALITVFLVIAISMGYVLGRTDATNKVEYLITNTQPESVVLQIFGNTLITAPIDRAAKTVQKSFSIHKIGEEPHLRLTIDNVGPLVPVAEIECHVGSVKEIVGEIFLDDVPLVPQANDEIVESEV
jgi:hypothetical protein